MQESKAAHRGQHKQVSLRAIKRDPAALAKVTDQPLGAKVANELAHSHFPFTRRAIFARLSVKGLKASG